MINFSWQHNRIFKDKYIVIGDWDFSSCENFSHCDYVSADTETKLYFRNKLLSEEEAHEMYQKCGAKFCRMNIEVKTYAFMLSDGKNFALFTNIEDFILCCSTMLVKKVFWYNAKFDFSIFDYYFLTNGWISSEELIEKFEDYKKKKLPDKTYQSLNGDFGQRYQLRIWARYKNKKRIPKVHNFKMVDICNIFGGGLRKNLEDWKIVDSSGKDVRKLHMDYVNASIENDIDYMIADTKGLHLLAEKIDKTIKEISGFSLFDGDYITAGGLAKKSFLKFLFGNKSPSKNMKEFKTIFPMTLKDDKKYRENNLYQGGKCLVSPYYVGQIVKNVYKYDINSMYPTQMRNMLYPVGNPKKVKKISDNPNKIYVLKISKIFGLMKRDMIPVWYDTITGEYNPQFFIEEPHYFWLEELEELKNYYELDYKVLEILEFDAYTCKGARNYVDTYYKIKKENKGTVRNGAKLFLNSAYGKLAQRVERVICNYKLSPEGYVHLEKSEEVEDEKSIMSVLVGSRITSLSRTMLMKYIREICKGNPKKYFLYCDTDSVHSLCKYEDTDDKELGKMKSEGIYEFAKYLAPKTYMLYHNIEENTYEYEIHTKGVNTNVVKEQVEKCKNFYEASTLFSSGKTFQCLVSLNCIGGKALLYIDKMLLNPKLEKKAIEDDEMED